MTSNRAKNLTYRESAPRTLPSRESLQRVLPTSTAAGHPDWLSLIIPGLILSLSLLPIADPGITGTKVLAGLTLLALTFPFIISAFLSRNRVPGQFLLMTFLITSIINILVAINNNLSIVNWFRWAFSIYIFVAMIFVVLHYGNSVKRRHNLWVTIIVFASIYGILRMIFAVSYGIEEAFEDRVVGFVTISHTGLLLLLPTIGILSIRHIWISLGLIINTIAMVLSGSRGNIVLIIYGFLYTFMFTSISYVKRLCLVILVLVMAAFITSTFVYENMARRLSVTLEGRDASSLGRLDEIISAWEEIQKSWGVFLFGKGFGASILAKYKISRNYKAYGAKADMIIQRPIHSELMGSWLYSGLVGFISYTLVLISIGKTLYKAIRRSASLSNDPYVRIRLHGAMLVLMSMVLWGAINELLIHVPPAIFYGSALGLGLAEAAEIYRTSEGH